MNPNLALENHNPLASHPFDETARVFNTSLIASRSQPTPGHSVDLLETMKSASFNAILVAVRYLAQSENISEALASDRVIETFRKTDRAWLNYVYNEGLTKIRGNLPQ